MAKRSNGVFVHGTARDADNAPGYTASGSSEFTRHSAHGSASQVADKQSFAFGDTKKKRSRLDLIRENRRELSKALKKLETERDPIRIEILLKSVEFKKFFLHKLEQERK
jgi:hypothetical protein